jgi:hypothetical protein
MSACWLGRGLGKTTWEPNNTLTVIQTPAELSTLSVTQSLLLCVVVTTNFIIGGMWMEGQRVEMCIIVYTLVVCCTKIQVQTLVLPAVTGSKTQFT